MQERRPAALHSTNPAQAFPDVEFAGLRDWLFGELEVDAPIEAGFDFPKVWKHFFGQVHAIAEG